MKFDGKKPAAFLICTAASIGLLCAGFNSDIFGLIFFSALLCLPLIYIRATIGTPALLISLAALFAAAYFLRGASFASIYLICAAIISFVCGYAVIAGKSFYDSALMCCIASAAVLGAVMLFIWIDKGQSLIDTALSKIEAMLSAMPDDTLKFLYRYTSVAAGGGSADLSSITAQSLSALSKETAVSGLMRYLTPSVTLTVPQLCSIGVLLSGLLYYVVPRAVLKKLKYRVSPIPPFSLWSLPKHFGIWSVVIYMVALIGYNAGGANFEIVYGIVYGAFYITYTIQGFAFVDWLLLKKISSVPARIAILAATWLLGSVIELYMWLGLLEQLLKLRKRAPIKF